MVWRPVSALVDTIVEIGVPKVVDVTGVMTVTTVCVEGDWTLSVEVTTTVAVEFKTPTQRLASYSFKSLTGNLQPTPAQT